jgi:predicted RNA-binding Zn-ribbon protein involved in translation (DUF1610 family)
MTSKKMICPDCGVEMNHHAEKIDYSAGMTDESPADSDLGGVLQEVHSCPVCGKTHMRRSVSKTDIKSS